MLAIALVSGGLLVLLAAQQVVNTTVEGLLATYWRGPYDLLVRPTGSQDPIEAEYGLVQARQLLTAQGGITWDQLAAIQNTPGVAVVAPVAVLGTVHLSAVIPYPALDQAGLYRQEFEAWVDIGAKVLRRHTVTYFVRVPPELRPRFYRHDPVVQMPDGSSISLHDLSRTYGLIFDAGIDDVLYAGMAVPTLLAAIDPLAEAEMFGLDGTVVEGRYLRPQDRATRVQGGYAIPVLMNRDVLTGGNMRAEIRRLAMSGEEADALRAAAETRHLGSSGLLREIVAQRGAADALPEARWEPVFSEEVSLLEAVHNGIDRVRQRAADPAWPPSPGAPHELPAPVTLVPAAQSGASSSLVLRAEPRGTSDWGTVLYRDLQRPPAEEAKVAPVWVGTIDIQRLQPVIDAMGLVALPPEIYTMPTATVVDDGRGAGGTEPVVLRPGLSEREYLLRPPLMLTTIQALRGLPLRAPISAVRVRVDVTRWDAAGRARLEEVAAHIVGRTGLEVDILTGSSPVAVLVDLPDFEATPGVGLVKEPWIKTGANLTVDQLVQSGDAYVFGPILILAALFMGSSVLLGMGATRREIGLLKGVGWSNRQVLRLVVGEQVLLVVTGALLGIGVAAVGLWAMALPFPWWRLGIVAGVAAAVAILALPAAVVIALQSPPIQLLRFGETGAAALGADWVSARHLLGFAVRSLLGTPALTFFSVCILGGMGAFATLLTLLLQNLQGALALTILGSHILVEIQPYHLLMVGVAAVIAGLGAADLFLLHLERRRREMALLRSTGWEAGEVGRLVLAAATFVGGVAGVLGALAGWLAFRLVAGPEPLPLWIKPAVTGSLGHVAPGIVVLGAALLPALVAVAAAVPAVRRATRIDPVVELADE